MMTRLAIELRFPQTIRIEVRGADVAGLDGNRTAVEDRSENAVPDVVERWVRAISVGLLGGASAAPPKCQAVVTRRHCDEDRRHQIWDVQIDAVDWGAFRILRNLLLARDFEECSVRTLVARGEGDKMLDFDTVAFPTMPETLPFAVERPGEGRPELRVELAFGNPSDETIDEAIAVLDLWAELVIWGGYAPAEMEPRRSGSFPTGAILFDECTVAQGFEQVFWADTAAFEAVISYALALAARGVFVSSVAIR